MVFSYGDSAPQPQVWRGTYVIGRHEAGRIVCATPRCIFNEFSWGLICMLWPLAYFNFSELQVFSCERELSSWLVRRNERSVSGLEKGHCRLERFADKNVKQACPRSETDIVTELG